MKGSYRQWNITQPLQRVKCLLQQRGVDLVIILLSEATQLEKDEIHMRLLMCGETENRLMSTRDWRLGKWGDVGQRAVQKLLIITMSKFWV